MGKLTVSVIIPTHDRIDLLKRAIESALNQTRKPDEVIVVDDLNDVATKKLCEQYLSSGVVYIPNVKGRGASSSRNLGALKAKSEFIAFLDDDDIWLPEKLEKQCSLIEGNGLDVCFSQLLIQYENTDISYPTNAKNLPEPKVEILMENYIGATISAVIRKETFLTINGFDELFKAREEYDLWIKLIHVNAEIGIVEEPLAISYRSLEQRDRISQNVDSYIEAIEMLNSKHEGLVNKFLNNRQKKVRKKKQFDFIAAQAVSIGLKREAVQYYFKSLLISPSVKALVGCVISIISPKLLIKLREKLS